MILLASCSGNPFFVQTTSLPTEGWNAADTVVIPIDCNAAQLTADDFCHEHDIHIGVRTTATYKYQNLSLLVELTRDKHVIRRDTLSISNTENQKDDNTGRAFINHPTLSIPGVKLSPLHSYSIRATHLMRLNPLPGITDIRVEVE